MKKRKIALIGPNFFSYIQAIRQCIAGRGYETEFFDERHSNSLVVKILYRIGYYAVFERTKRAHLDRVAAAIVAGGHTDVLLIDVEVTDAAFVRTLKAAGVKTHIYMWDSADNKPRFTKYLDELDGKGSFDPADCARYGLTYVPLFAEDIFSPSASGGGRDIDVSFCGTLHSDRARWLKRLESFAAARSLSVVFLLFYHSRWLLLLLSLRHPWNLFFLRRVSCAGFPKRDIASVFARSRFVFDLPHAKQKGLTARTFEALRSGARLITSNEHVGSLPGALVSRTVLIRGIEDLDKIDFAALTPLPAPTRDEDYFLSLGRFADQMLEMMGIPGGRP